MNVNSLTTNQWLKQATGRLSNVGISTARLDCLILLEDRLHKDRSWILAHPETQLERDTIRVLEELIARRAAHEPLSYIRGKTEFYSREFTVNKHVLEPRPESETMIDLLKKLPADMVADIGTGSGAIAITAKLEIPRVRVLAVDIDPECLQVAAQNAKKHHANITLFQGNLLEPLLKLKDLPTILLCNLPYVPDNHTLNDAAMNEPHLAIFGGKDGLDLYRTLFEQLKSLPIKHVITESLPFQHKMLERIAFDAGYEQSKEEGFIQLFTATIH